MIKDLPTASLPPDFRAKIAKKSRVKGSGYERIVAKKIAGYFGWKWTDAFIRTGPHSYAQPEGDLKPINEMWSLWTAAKLGPIECKNREEWSFGQLFRNPEKSKLYEYWVKSNNDTKTKNSVLFFTKNGLPDLVMEESPGIVYAGPTFSFIADGEEQAHYFSIVTLKDFLTMRWPR